MTPSSKPPDITWLQGQVREFTTRYQAGTEDSFEAYGALASLLLRLTVLHPSGGIRITYGEAAGPAVGGWRGPTDPIPLNDGNFLRLSTSLYLEATPDGNRMKVRNSSYQYQLDPDGDHWIFRYDYLRVPRSSEPPAHLQIRGTLIESGEPLERLRFPTGRVSLEAVIRLLVDQFDVPCNEDTAIWRPILALSERLFLDIAHRPLSGPSG